MLSESYDKIPPTPREKFKHFTKIPSHISLIEIDDDFDESFNDESNKFNEKTKDGDSILSDDRYEDSFDGKEEETEAESGSLSKLHKNLQYDFDN